MSLTPPIIRIISQYAAALRQYWYYAAIPTAVMTLGALGYAVVKPDVWEATQAIHIRNEAAGTSDGSFHSVDAMQTAQGTMLELARNQAALADALRAVGPPANRRSIGAFPSAEEVDALRDAISIYAPGGAEFGRTEVAHVRVKAATRDRAVALTNAVCDQLQENWKKLRDDRTSSVIDELKESQRLAQIDLQAATKKLEKLESEIGSDLPEIRILDQSGTGESPLRTSLTQIKNELRAAQTSYDEKIEQLKHLEAARKNVNPVLALPTRLLELQPALKQLKDGLVAAQLRTAELSGTMSADHPKVQSAKAAEQEIASDLRKELNIAVKSLQADTAIIHAQVGSLTEQRDAVEQRLNRLASLRARYHNLESSVKQRAEIVQSVEKKLSDAKASNIGGKAASLITRIDTPQLSTYPVGPGRTLICLVGLFGGAATGLGLVFLVSPQGQSVGRRWSDSVATFQRRATDMLPGFGRRNSDRSGGKRAGDPAPAVPGGRRDSDPPAVNSNAVESQAKNWEQRSGSDRRTSPR